MFVTVPRVLVIDRPEGKNRIRIKNGDTFFTAFFSKKLPPIPESVKEGSQVDLSGFIKATFSEKYGMQYSLTVTALVERNHDTGKAKNTITEPGEPVSEAPANK